MTLDGCPPSVAIVELRPPGVAPLRVELSTSASSFRHVGAYGLSPIGSFDDWAKQPEPHRRGLDALADCVRADPPEVLLAPDASPPAGDVVARPASLPWLFLAAVLAGVFAVRPAPRSVAIAGGAIVATVLARRGVQSMAFFHQNGQGPEWIRFALQGDAGGYGPGYPELFGAIATRVRRPDLAVFFAQELLAATVPIAGYAIARAMRCTKLVACTIAVVLALDPVLTRTGRSESYYVAITALLFAAAAILVSVDRRERRVAAVFSAALLTAEAARIHPVAWVACAMVSLPLLVGREQRHALRRFAIATVAIALVAAPLVIPAMRAAIRGKLGASIADARGVALGAAPRVALLLAIVVAIAAVRRSLGVRALVLATVVGAAAASNVLRGNIAVVSASYDHLFLPAAVAAVASLVASLNARAIASSVALVGGLHAYRERAAVPFTTDGHELAWCLDWREQLGPGATVATLSRVGQRTLTLPFFGSALPRARGLEAEAAFYYRSSLCTSPEGAPLCASFEARHRLRQLQSRILPSNPSAAWLPLPPSEIEVALFAVDGQR